MTKERTIEILQSLEAYFRTLEALSYNALRPPDEISGQCAESSKAISYAINLIKTLEKKPLLDINRELLCPTCRKRIAGLAMDSSVLLETDDTPNYCWNCGQALDWSNDDD